MGCLVYQKLFQETKAQQNDLCDIILNNDFQEYLKAFESEFEKALRNSIFEYNTKFITYIYRNDEAYRTGKLHCNNIRTKFVFHGTKSSSISRILAGNFLHASVHFFGIGAYFTDLLDYSWFYAAETDNEFEKFKNVSRIPKINESFSLVASEISSVKKTAGFSSSCAKLPDAQRNRTAGIRLTDQTLRFIFTPYFLIII